MQNTFIASFDASKAATLRSFYNTIAKKLHFQSDFGNNLDALFDCLTSLDNIEESKVVLTISNAAKFLEKESLHKKNAVLDIFKEAEIAENRYDDKEFEVIFID
jgi:RNAse (barnase) inhibitor barstar